jgi:hypothetical protein
MNFSANLGSMPGPSCLRSTESKRLFGSVRALRVDTASDWTRLCSRRRAGHSLSRPIGFTFCKDRCGDLSVFPRDRFRLQSPRVPTCRVEGAHGRHAARQRSLQKVIVTFWSRPFGSHLTCTPLRRRLFTTTFRCSGGRQDVERQCSYAVSGTCSTT